MGKKWDPRNRGKGRTHRGVPFPGEVAERQLAAERLTTAYAKVSVSELGKKSEETRKREEDLLTERVGAETAKNFINAESIGNIFQIHLVAVNKKIIVVPTGFLNPREKIGISNVYRGWEVMERPVFEAYLVKNPVQLQALKNLLSTRN
ncbi:MAG: hypothetical protein NUV57_02870 [archaeon]|nr:hypothetical protein [archaeon]